MQAERSIIRAHGLWSLGVYVMRNLRFAPKMALLMGLMALALAAVAWSYYSGALANIAFSGKERVGVQYLRALYPALEEVMKNPASEQARKALQALEETELTLGPRLETEAAYRSFKETLEAAGSPERQALEGSRALAKLAATVCDNSNLTLDPEVHTYYLMDIACFRSVDIVSQKAVMLHRRRFPQADRVLGDRQKFRFRGGATDQRRR